MPPTRRRSASTVRSAATRIQKRVRGKQTRKKTSALMRDKRNKRNLEIANRNLEITNECAICLAEVLPNDPITSLDCGHRFHTECIMRSMQSGIATCPLCRSIIPNNDYAHLANPTMTYEQALSNRNQALEERRLATQALTNAQERTNNYERSNRTRRLRGVNSPTYIRLLRTEEEASEELARARERVTNSMRIISSLAN
jgi:hypothetical protein